MISGEKKLIAVLVSILFLAFGKVNGQCYFIQSDRFDNIWVVNNSEVVCFNKQLKKIGSYSNILFGNPFYVDALDPFRIIVFYQATQSVAILNNAVAEIAKPVRLREKGVGDASLVCRSSRGGFWVLDRASWEILYFDSGFNSTGEKVIPDIMFSGSKPLFMKEDNGILYLAFQGKGICRFDSFGAKMGDIPVEIDDYFTFFDGSIVYRTKGRIFQYNLENNRINIIDSSWPCMPAKQQGRFIFFDGRELSVYKIN